MDKHEDKRAPVAGTPVQSRATRAAALEVLNKLHYSLLESIGELGQSRAKCLADEPQLYDIEYALAAFQLANKRLGNTKQSSKLNLGNPSRRPTVSSVPEPGAFTISAVVFALAAYPRRAR